MIGSFLLSSLIVGGPQTNMGMISGIVGTATSAAYYTCKKAANRRGWDIPWAKAQMAHLEGQRKSVIAAYHRNRQTLVDTWHAIVTIAGLVAKVLIGIAKTIQFIASIPSRVQSRWEAIRP